MSDDNDKSPSASEIVDSMAEELGIEDEDVPESDFSEEMMDELGGLFSVSSEEGAEAGQAGESREGRPAPEGFVEDSAGEEVHQEETVEMSLKVAKAVADTDSLDEDVREQLGETLEGLREQHESEAAVSSEREEASGRSDDDEKLAESLASLADNGAGGGSAHQDVEPDEELNVADEEKKDEETSSADSEAEQESTPEEDEAVEATQEEASTEEADAEPEDDAAGEETADTASEQADTEAQTAEAASEQAETEAQTAEAEDEAAAEPEGGHIGGVFDPEDNGADELEGGGYLGDDDLPGYESQQSDMGIFWVSVAIVILLIGGGTGVIFATGQQERLYHLFKGDLPAWEKAKAEQEKLRHQMEQQAKLPKFGTLVLKGRPFYSTIKLDGHVQYGQLSSGEWKVLRIKPKPTTLRNLDAKKKHTVEITSPHHEPKSWELTEETWNEVSGSDVDVRKSLSIDLQPNSDLRRKEFKKRMEKDTENNYYGEVTINTMPSGAKVIFDGKPLLNEDGEEMTTPVTFKKYWVENKETGELEEKKIKVDTPPDSGHKIQLRMPEEKGDYPKFVASLQRQMWTCNWKKKEEELKKMLEEEDDVLLPEHCNFTYTLDFSFKDLQSYIEERKKRKKEVKERNKKIAKDKKGGSKTKGGEGSKE